MGCGGSKEPVEQEEADEDFRVEAPTEGRAERQRGAAVRAETGTDFEDPDDDFDPEERFPKSDAEYRSIRAAMLKNSVFSQCTEEQLKFLGDGFVGLEVERGEVIVQQGVAGDNFFIVETGHFVEEDEPTKSLIAEYSSGGSFGEVVLLYSSPYAATVTCKKSGLVWALERKRFRYTMVTSGAKGLAEKADKFLKPVPLLAPLTDAQLASLASCLQEVRFEDGESIVKKGDIADAMFFVKRGGALIVAPQTADSGNPERLGVGSVFGEGCLEPSSSRAVREASVVAVGATSMLRLTATSFKEQLGSLPEVIAYNLKRDALECLTIDGTNLFDHLSGEAQEGMLKAMGEKTCKQGEKLADANKASDTLFIVKSGTVSVGGASGSSPSKGESAAAAQLGSGSVCNERALLTGAKAAATITASSLSVVAHTLSRAAFIEAYGSPLETLLATAAKKLEKRAKLDRPKWDDLEVRRVLGCGTYGRVKLTVHTPTGKTYALKCMRKAQVVKEKAGVANVLMETKILRMMDHPFILNLMQTYQVSPPCLLSHSPGSKPFPSLPLPPPLRLTRPT